MHAIKRGPSKDTKDRGTKRKTWASNLDALLNDEEAKQEDEEEDEEEEEGDLPPVNPRKRRAGGKINKTPTTSSSTPASRPNGTPASGKLSSQLPSRSNGLKSTQKDPSQPKPKMAKQTPVDFGTGGVKVVQDGFAETTLGINSDGTLAIHKTQDDQQKEDETTTKATKGKGTKGKAKQPKPSGPTMTTRKKNQ